MRLKLFAGLALLAVASLARADDPEAAQRTAFRLALDQARSGVQSVAPDSAALQRYPLYSYLLAARLQTQLAKAPSGSSDEAISQFLASNAQLPVTRDLQKQWLLDLAQRSQWPRYLAQLPDSAGDPTLTCYRWQARIATVDDSARAALARDLLKFWATAPQMPSACVPAFDWLQQQQLITADVREQRARQALTDGNTGLASSLIQDLPPERASPLRQWQQLLDDPSAAFKALAANTNASVEPAALQAGFDKLVRRDTDAAEQALSAFKPPRVDASKYAELSRSLALGLAWNRAPEALDYFRALPMPLNDSRTLEWRIRAALWNRAWPQAAQWLAELPPAMAAEQRWMYWRARVAEQLGKTAEAKSVYETLARDNGYYPLLAAARLQQPYQPRLRTLADDAETQTRLLKNAALIRARELFYAGEITWANVEWKLATQSLSDAERIQVARLASRWGWHWQTVLTLNQLKPELDAGAALDLLYPRAFSAEINGAAAQAQLPPNWIYGVMRQESLFLPQAVSSSDALGLLQLKLSTARDVARRIGLPKPQHDDLFQPPLNVKLGSAYLRQLTDRFDGQFALTVCAYNGGPNAVARWLPDTPMDADIWIENVPFNETRNYVQRIVWHIAVHSWQETGQVHDVDALLQPVRRPAS